MKSVVVIVLMFGLAACSSGGGSGGTIAKSIGQDANLYIDPGFVKPATASAAETTLRGNFINQRNNASYLNIDNAGNWSFQFDSGRYRIVNGQQILTPYTYQSSGTTPIATTVTDDVWIFTFDVDVYTTYAPFDGLYDDAHNRLALKFLSDKCVLIQIKGLNQSDFDVWCKQ